MIPLVAITGVLLFALAAIAFARPELRRLAVRRAMRRRADTRLLVLGCAVGTTIITGSLLIGDTLETSLRDRAPERLGPVDVVVSSYAVPTARAAEDTLTSEPPAASDGVLPVTSAGATLATPEEDGEREVIPDVQLLELNFEKAQSFGGDTADTGIKGTTPETGEILLAQDTAEALGVEPGDSVELYAYGQFRLFQVGRVLEDTGLAGYATGFAPNSANAFVAPGTISGLTSGVGVSEDARPPEYLLLVSGKGGVFSGVERTDELVQQINARLGTLLGYEVQPVKRDLLVTASEDGAEFAELFLSLGAFGILAGTALLINLLVMLSESRRRELGVLRSLGMNRRDLTLAFVFEGALYAAVAGVLGVLAGIGMATLISLLAENVFSSARPGGLDLRLGVSLESLLAGFLGGFVVSVAVVAVAAAWIGRMTVVEAIRDTARPELRDPKTWVTVMLACLAMLFAGASIVTVATGQDFGSLALPPLALVCLAATVLRSMKHRAENSHLQQAVTVGSAIAVMLWVVLAFPLLGLNVDNVTLFVVQGLALTLAAVFLIGRYQGRIGAALRRLAGGTSLVLRLALSYPSEHRLRTGATLLSYSLIVFTLVFSSVLSGVFSSQAAGLAADEGGGYDLLVTTGPADPVEARELTDVEGVEGAATLNWTVAGFRVGDSGRFEDWAVSGFDEEFLEGGAPALEAFDRDRFPDEAAVWEAVLEDPDLAIADIAFLESGGGPPEDNVTIGDTVQMQAPAGETTAGREVVAISAAGAAFSGVMMSKSSLDAVVENTTGNRFYVALSSGADPEAVADRLQREFLASGLEARSFEQVVQEALRSQEQFFDLIEGYLALGLFIGIAGLGIVMIRAARERRYQIGVLRSLGFSPAAVRAAFLAESSLVALEGVLIGAGLALLTTYELVVASSAFGEAEASFSVPWMQLVLLLVGVLVASILSALPAASRASAESPAETLRAAG